MNSSEQGASLSSTYDRNTNVSLSHSSLLGYRAGMMNNMGVCGSVGVCQRISGEKSCGVSPSQREAWSWRWACPLAAWVCGEPGSYKAFGKEGEQEGERQEGRYRKRMGSECLPMEKRCAGIVTECCRGPADKESLYDSWTDCLRLQMSLTHSKKAM